MITSHKPVFILQINKEQDNGTMAGIDLIGSQEAQNAAQQMINDLVSSSHNSGYGELLLLSDSTPKG